MGRIVAQNMAWWGCHVEHTQNSNKNNKRKEKGWGAVWPRLRAPRGSWVLRCGYCPFPFAQEGCRPSVLSMAIPAISGDVGSQEGSLQETSSLEEFLFFLFFIFFIYNLGFFFKKILIFFQEMSSLRIFYLFIILDFF